MEEYAWQIFTVLRLFVPLLILRWPLVGIFASALIDLHDYNQLPLSTDADYAAYQSWDKLFDIYYLSLAALVVCKWKENSARIVALGLYAYRLFGIGIMELTGNRQFLLLFPNVFENFVIFYLLYKAVEQQRPLLRSAAVAAGVLIPLTLLKLLQEYYLHIVEAQPGTNIMGFYDMNILIWAGYITIFGILLTLVAHMPSKIQTIVFPGLRLLARQ